MEDNKIDLILQEHFSETFPLESGLITKTKMLIREKAEKKNNLLLCLIQVGYLLMSLALLALVILSFGVSFALIILVIGYFAVISLVAIVLALVKSRNNNTLRRIRIHG